MYANTYPGNGARVHFNVYVYRAMFVTKWNDGNVSRRRETTSRVPPNRNVSKLQFGPGETLPFRTFNVTSVVT